MAIDKEKNKEEFEKRLIVVAVGYGESCDDSHHQENAAGNALIFF